MIYLDNAATAKTLPSSLEAVKDALSADGFFNPSALYSAKDKVHKSIEKARGFIASRLKCEPCEVYFTSGATESNNRAVLGGGLKRKKLSSVTSKGEHASVFESFAELSRRGGMTKFAGLNYDSTVKTDEIINLALEDCGFLSLIHASNETGAINDISGIFGYIKKKNPQIILHSDGVQAFGKVETDVNKMNVDLYSISGHKIGAPKGIGALYIKSGIHIPPSFFGGAQERGQRAGTENVAGILAFGAAIEEFTGLFVNADVKSLRDKFIKTLTGLTGGVLFNTAAEGRQLQNILSLSVIGVRSEILQRILCDNDNIIIGLGSACAASKKGNRVLEAAGRGAAEVEGNIRISFGIDTDILEVEKAAMIVAKRIKELRGKQSGAGNE